MNVDRSFWFCGNLAPGQACLIDHQCSSKKCIGNDPEEDTPGTCGAALAGLNETAGGMLDEGLNQTEDIAVARNSTAP